MKQIKKFRKNDWSEEVETERREPRQKKFERALRTLDIDYLTDYDEDY
jgi:7,8-dihydro-6-hydroxymethylpterin-pyrophosphokinase